MAVGRKQIWMMTEEELAHVKARMEQLLIERGVHLDHDPMLKDLAACGCIVDFENKDVKFTKELIDKAVAAVPAEVEGRVTKSRFSMALVTWYHSSTSSGFT